MTEKTLLPCPFCGGAPKTSHRPESKASGGGHVAFIVCYCGGYASTAHQMGHAETAQAAIAEVVEKWNRRAQPAEAEGVGVVGFLYKNNGGALTAADMDSDTFALMARYDFDGEVEKLVRQVDHLAALAAVTAERDRLREDRDSQQRVCIAEMEKVSQLRAEVEALCQDAALGSAIQRACRDLPESFMITVWLEKDAGTLELCLPDTDAVLDDFDGNTLAEQIGEAIDAAVAAKER